MIVTSTFVDIKLPFNLLQPPQTHTLKSTPLNNGMESRTRLEIPLISSYIGSVLRETAEERDRRLFLERKQKKNNGEAARKVTESIMRML